VLRIRSLALSGLYALGALWALSYAFRVLPLSRAVCAGAYVAAGIAMALARVGLRVRERRLAASGCVLQRLAVAGCGSPLREFVKRVRAHRGGLQLIGAFHEGERPPIGSLPGLGRLSDIRLAYERSPFGILVLSSADRIAGAAVMDVVNFCEEKGVCLYVVPDSFDVAVAQHEVGSFFGMPLVRLCDASIHPTLVSVKRLMDIVLSAAGIVLGMPLWLLIAFLVRVTTRGPVFFTQMRAGLHGRPFRIIKFRTMVADAEARLGSLIDVDKLEVPGFKIKNDPRVTPVGRFLRRTGLDEVPQLINVLKGEMSLVGPRPEMLNLVERYTPEQRRRLKAKPGITGYQQVMARGIPLAAGVKYDLVYLKYQSLSLDLYILLKTILVVLRGSGITH